MKDKHIKAHMKSLPNYAECSTARRAQVGCLIVKEDRVISIGYNGTPPGWDNSCEEEVLSYFDSPTGPTELRTKPEVMHAESNALMKLCKSTESSKGAVLFCTYSPCFECAKLILSAGIVYVFYSQMYETDDGAGLDFLKKGRLPAVWVDKEFRQRVERPK